MSNQYSYGGGGGGGYGAPPPGQQGGYGAPPPGQQGGYGQQPPGGGYGAPPPGQQGGYGAPPPGQQGGYGAPPPGQQGGYGGGGAQQSSYGAPPGQGYGRPQVYNSNTGPPPGADPQLWQWFIAVDRDRSGQINPQELSQALVNGDWTPFDLDTVKMLMSVFDVDRSGHISFNEFAGLWKYIQDWQGVFRHFDQDRSGSIDQNELANALQSFGYRLSPKLLHIVTQKYSGMAASGPGGRGAAGITFDRFVRACVVIKTLTESFQRHDTNRSGWVQINYDTFMEMCLSAP
ncbi:related to programmed cell death protein (calcium-binding protein) [Moesziomyces antarcticus]|uniref:Related to programmed cell death protein (Calcium-binding protein) n=1 Tax=Pseudozyma antarctica TaxID=84753 RepID=A0A5C3FYF6_PSEA2|nr:related to programmed cell death protein (calcium-binding protein) [Moesziomyces antarcticus]